MGVTFTCKGKKRYRYYLCVRASKSGYDSCPVRSVPAGDVEKAVVEQLREVFRAPEVIARTYRAAVAKCENDDSPTETEVAEALRSIDPVWDMLLPGERERLVKLLVDKVVVNPDSLEVSLRTNGLGSLIAELGDTAEQAGRRKVPA